MRNIDGKTDREIRKDPAYVHNFPSLETYPLELGLGPRQVPIRVKISLG